MDFKNPNSPDSMKKTADELIEYYKVWLAKYPLVSIEDPFDQDDWEAYTKFMVAVGKDVQVVGDDLLVTNPKRIKKGMEVAGCNALLCKVNQIGSITESIEAVTMCQAAGWGVMVSHRSGETEDSFIADLVVGLRTGEIKTGAPCRSERLAKYNQLLRIEEDLGPRCSYAGEGFRTVGILPKGMFRKPVVGGNWKCNGSQKMIKDLLHTFCGAAPSQEAVETIIFPTALHIDIAKKATEGKNVSIGTQNCSKTKEGAFTGELSCGMIKDAGLNWTLVGHSERRTLFGDTDAGVAEKVKLGLAAGLNVMICIGEVLEERKTGKTQDVCTTQMMAVIPSISDWSKIVIAYEPVWAIGTGVVATPLQAQETHNQVRQLIREQCGSSIADTVRILYGGSVSPGNCVELGMMPDIDGFLVGGASLKPDFTKIFSAAAKAYGK